MVIIFVTFLAGFDFVAARRAATAVSSTSDAAFVEIMAHRLQKFP